MITDKGGVKFMKDRSDRQYLKTLKYQLYGKFEKYTATQ